MWSHAKECTSCRTRQMQKDAPTLAIVAVHPDANEPSRVQVKNNTITCTRFFRPRFYYLRLISESPNQTGAVSGGPVGGKPRAWRSVEEQMRQVVIARLDRALQRCRDLARRQLGLSGYKIVSAGGILMRNINLIFFLSGIILF